MIEPSDITIIIPHLGKTEEQKLCLEMCVESLQETLDEPGYSVNIVIALNGVANENTYKLPDNCAKLHRIVLTEQGQCRASNAAVITSNSPWILVTNDDMVYPAHWFRKLTKGIKEKDTRYWCVSPKLIEPRPGAPTFEVYDCGGTTNFNKQKFLGFPSDYYKRQDLGWRTGFNLPFLIKRELWNTIEGYDVNYDPWGSNSDSDLEYKIKLAGVQPMQNTEAIVYHFSQTSGTFKPENHGYWNANWDYFIEKWGFPRTDDGIWEANFKMPGLNQRRFRPEWEGKYHALQS